MKSIWTLVAVAFISLSQLAATLPGNAASDANLDARALPPNAPSLSMQRKKARPPKRPVAEKYFHEPGGDDSLGHYDIRYFKGEVPYDAHLEVLRHLIRSYLTTFRSIGVETWLAHGTLLGWWWNGQIMPWDYDLDVQVSDVSLFYLGKHYNRTKHEYRYHNTTGKEVVKTFLLDVNPHHSMPRGNGQNIIDARWIDLENGMFIDITGLAEREPKHSPGIWSCKNFHRYRTRDLFPMRQTTFEGVPATIPYSFEKILTDEYGSKSLVITDWLGHKWDPEQKDWIKKKTDYGAKMAQTSPVTDNTAKKPDLKKDLEKDPKKDSKKNSKKDSSSGKEATRSENAGIGNLFGLLPDGKD